MVWRLTPKPDLVVLLDAPSEVVQGRKQEGISFEETRRQREAYRSLVGNLPHSVIIDASRPLEAVVRDVNLAILECLYGRTVKRLSLETEQ